MSTNGVTGWRAWLVLNRKIKSALATALTLNGGTVVAWLGGTVTGKQALVAIIGLDLPVIAGYLTPGDAVTAVRNRLRKPSP